MNITKYTARLSFLSAYAVATLFPRLLDLPIIGAKVQVTEIIFLFALPFFVRDLPATIKRFPAFSVAGGLYVLVNVLSGWLSGDTGALLEGMARGYLFVLALMAATLVRDRAIREEMAGWWVGGTTLVAAVSAFVWLGVAGGLPNPWIMVADLPDYPYLGDVFRLRGTATVYGMFAMLLLPGGVLAFEQWRRGKASFWPFTIILIAAVMTLAKEILLYGIGFILLYAATTGAPKKSPRTNAGGQIGAKPGLLVWVAVGCLAVTLLFGTHFILHQKGSALEGSEYVTERTVFELNNWVVSETNYMANKRGALVVGGDHPWLGVGPGRYQEYTGALIEQGTYPAVLKGFNPHSAWFGAFAETGLTGLLSLVGLVVVVWYHVGRRALSALAITLLLFLLASIFKDVMNFRALWLLIGCTLVPPESKKG